MRPKSFYFNKETKLPKPFGFSVVGYQENIFFFKLCTKYFQFSMKYFKYVTKFKVAKQTKMFNINLNIEQYTWKCLTYPKSEHDYGTLRLVVLA